MEDKCSFEQVRAEVEAKQEGILWEKAHKNGVSVDAFLWKGDPHAKPVQRAGLVVFAVFFLLAAIAFASIPFQRKFEDGWSLVIFLSFVFLLLSLRLFFNAFRRSKNARSRWKEEEMTDEINS